MQNLNFAAGACKVVNLWRGLPAEITVTGVENPAGTWSFLADDDREDGPVLAGTVALSGTSLVVSLANTNTAELAAAIQGQDALRCRGYLTDGTRVIPVPLFVLNRAVSGTPTPVAEYYTKAEVDALDATHYTKAQIDAAHYTKTEIDTAHYTKTQIDAMLNSSVYGLDYDSSISTALSACKRVVLNMTHDRPGDSLRYTQVNSFADMPAHDFRRCVMDDLANRHINYYLDPADSTKKLDGSAACLTGADGDVMVEIPVAYWRIDEYFDSTGHKHIVWLVSDKPFAGADVHPYFKVGPGGNTVRKQYVGAYKSTICDAAGNRLNTDESAASSAAFATGYKARSVAGAKPLTSITQARHRTAAGNNGAKGVNGLFHQYLMLMMAIDCGSFHTQAGISVGFTYAASVNYAFTRLSGRCNFGNGTGQIWADAVRDAAIQWTAGATDAQKVIQFQYRGIENPYGEVWECEDGIVKVDSGYYWTADDTKYSDTDYETDYTLKSFQWPASGWATEWDRESFLPTVIGGASTIGLTDYFYTTSGGARIVFRGGLMNHGVIAGGACIYAYSVLATSDTPIGMRISC